MDLNCKDSIFGAMTKFRVISYFILLISISVLKEVVNPKAVDLVFSFFFLVAASLLWEMAAPEKPKKKEK